MTTGRINQVTIATDKVVTPEEDSNTRQC